VEEHVILGEESSRISASKVTTGESFSK